MGYRAHVITQHREYGSSIFGDYDFFESYMDDMRDIHGDENINVSEDGTFIEIGRTVIEEEIKRLKKLGEEEKFEIESTYGDDFTNDEIISSWQSALDEAPADDYYISLEWY